MSYTLIVHTDGGSRGNPGEAACAFVIRRDDEVIEQQGFFLGITTNNTAEYLGVVKAHEWLLAQSDLLKEIKEINFFLDSELIVRQLNGIYKIKHLQLKNYYKMIRQFENILKQKAITITYAHVRREENKDADSLVNITLDEK